MPDFVHKIETHPDMLCICGKGTILEEFEKVLLLQSLYVQLLSYDTTFQLGNFIYLHWFQHTLFHETPIIPAIFMLHEWELQYCHEQM